MENFLTTAPSRPRHAKRQESHYTEHPDAAYVRRIAANVRKLWQDRTPAEFLEHYHYYQRNDIFRKLLPTIEYYAPYADDHDDPYEVSLASMYCLPYFMGTDDEGKQIALEARAACHAKTRFVVPSYYLKQFVQDHHYNSTYTKNARRITIEIHTDDEKLPMDYDSTLVDDLEQLKKFRSVDCLAIHIHSGQGPLNELDPATAQQMKAIAKVLRELHRQLHVNIFHIRKVQDRKDKVGFDLFPYWQRPTRPVWQRYWDGTATLKDRMRIEIEELCEEIVSYDEKTNWEKRVKEAVYTTSEGTTIIDLE